MSTLWNDRIDGIVTDEHLASVEADYKLQQVAAESLGITLEEYLDFVADMEVDTVDYTFNEIEQMYVEYCEMFEIPCLQIDNPMALCGAI